METLRSWTAFGQRHERSLDGPRWSRAKGKGARWKERCKARGKHRTRARWCTDGKRWCDPSSEEGTRRMAEEGRSRSRHANVLSKLRIHSLPSRFTATRPKKTRSMTYFPSSCDHVLEFPFRATRKPMSSDSTRSMLSIDAW